MINKQQKEILKLCSIRTKKKTKKFVRVKIFPFHLQGLKSKFAIFLETKYLFNSTIYNKSFI